MAVLAIILLILVIILAMHLDRSVIGFVLLSFLLSPLIALIILACVGRKRSRW